MKRSLGVLALASLLTAPCFSDEQPDPSKQDLASMTIEQLMTVKVEGASLHPQSLEDAPASVTIISAEEIRKYGYTTLAEALSTVRGFYLNDNRTYRTMGVRGFNSPSDYGSRMLVLVNGHNMAENVFDSMLWFGVDFPIDMKLVQRIEVIRGPSSALYGSSGLFATINVITKTPAEAGPVSMSVTTGSFGQKQIQAMGAVRVGKGAAVLLSGTVFNNSGEESLFFPALDSPETNRGNAIRVDGEKGYHFFANLTWRNWNFTGVLSDRNKIEPISFGATVFNDRGTHLAEDSNYAEAAYTRDMGGGTLKWRTYYNQTRLNGRFDYPLFSSDGSSAGVEDNRTFSWGDWIGSALTYRFDAGRIGTLTAGLEGKVDLRAYQGSRDVEPAPQVFVNVDRRDRMAGLFFQDEIQLFEHWKLDLGVRIDASRYRSSFASPRAALIYQPSSAWTYKALYGRAFRNPSAFDLFYDDATVAVANPAARPEKIDTVELDIERRLGKRMMLLTSGYAYLLQDFLQGVFTPSAVLQTQNTGRIHATGFEIEITGRPWTRLEATASYSVQQSIDELARKDLPNSPNHLAKLRFALPLGKIFDVSTGMQYYSSRSTLANARVAPVYVADFMVASKGLFRTFDIRFGLRNAFDRRYSDPIALDSRVDSMPQPGRSVFVELTTHGAQ